MLVAPAVPKRIIILDDYAKHVSCAARKLMLCMSHCHTHIILNGQHYLLVE